MTDDYSTPSWLKNIFKYWYDPCPLNFTIDGLKVDWMDFNYVNPPYSNPLPWIEKAIEEAKKGKTIVLLLKVDTSTKWYAKLVEAGARFLFINGRLKFNDGKSPANFPSMLAILSK